MQYNSVVSCMMKHSTLCGFHLKKSNLSPPTHSMYHASFILYSRSFLCKKGEKMRNHKGCTHACFLEGGAEACGGGAGQQQLHDPPLIFDVEREEAEERPLQVDTPEYQAAAKRIARRREELLWDIATDKSVSTTDYSTDKSAAPCCDQRQAVCRCRTLV